jgi:hypothetical protein
MNEEDKSFTGLTLSILLHIGLVLLLIYMPKPTEVARPETTEITILDPGKKAQSFVADTSIPQKDLLKELKEKAKFLSKETRRVKEETKAKNTGRTQNNITDIPMPSLDEPSGVGAQQGGGRKGGGGKQQTPTPQIHSSMAGLQPKPKQIGGAEPGAQEGFGKNLVIGSSSLAEYIPGIKTGGFTALNTDQFTYYTFFERINEQVRFRWVTLVRNYLGGLSDSQMNALAKYQRVFQIEIVLSDSGQYLKGFIHRTSGEQALDMTSIDAFQSAAPFLNPPKGLVEEDGFIHLHYSFIVEFRPRTGLGSN